ncbi:MAG: EamA family transporter [Cyanobium sp. NAT70]|nr:EamA family transporter [Cyanobium sp. NAT70]|tara:strand:- start:200 stop:1021 length:822 start_codon:yes stop_codon:yes gene_type:complete
MTVCVKQIGGRLPVAEIVLVRALISVLLTAIGLRIAGISPWGQRKGLLLLRGLCGSIALLCFFQAISDLPLASATVLQYTYPTFTALAAWLFLGEQLRRSIVLAVVLGWIGITLVVQPSWLTQGLQGLPLLAVLIALGGALFTALAYVCVRRLSTTEHPLVIILYFPMLSIPLTLPAAIQQGSWPTSMEWLWLIGVGVFTQLGQIWVTQALSTLPAARATSINYVQVIFAAMWGWFIFEERLNHWVISGGALVLVSTLMSLSSRQQINHSHEQ